MRHTIILLPILFTYPSLAFAAPEIVELWLVDATTDTRIERLQDNQVLMLPVLPRQLTIEAVAIDAGAVEMRVNGVVTSLDDGAPFALDGDWNGDIAASPALATPGSIEVSAEAFEFAGGTGASGPVYSLSLQVFVPDYF